MTYILNDELTQYTLDRFDYLVSRCTGDTDEARDIACGVTDRAHLHSLLCENIDAHWDAVFCELGIWDIVSNRGANLLSPSFPLRGVRLALEQSLADRRTL